MSVAGKVSIVQKRGQHAVQRALGLEAHPGHFWEAHMTVLHRYPVGKAAEGLEHARIRLVASQAESGRDVQGHLMAAMGHYPTP